MKLTRSTILLLTLAFAWVAGLLSAPAMTASAAPSAQNIGLKMTATPSYNGYFKYGEWLPVRVYLEKEGSDLENKDVEVRVSVSSSMGTIVYASPVTLPAGSRKQVVIYVLPNNFSREIVIQVVSGDEVLANTKATVRPQPNINYTIGLLTPDRGALSLLSGIKLPGQERSRVLVDLTLADLPDRPEALRTFDLLVLNDMDTSSLTPGQAKALQGWVQQGGHLVIGGGPGAQRTLAGLSEELLPVAFGSTVEIDAEDAAPLAEYANTEAVAGSGSFIAALGTINNSQIRAGDENMPLVIEHGTGTGSVHFVALDLSAAPFNGWAGTTRFWETIIGPGGAYPENMPFDTSMRQYRSNSLFYALSNIPSLDLPSVRGLSILLFIYILMVGPVNYFALRLLKRMQLAWVTIPVLTALFSAAAFGIGYGLRGNDLVLNKIGIVQLQPGGTAGLTTYMGLFSPRQQSYEVLVEGEGLVSPMSGYEGNPWGNPGGTTSGGQMIFTQGAPTRVEGLTVNQWAMQSFMSEGLWEDFGTLSAELSMENETLTGTVRNETAYPLTDVVVVFQNRFARLGDMAPGAVAEVSLGLSNLQSDRFNSPVSYRLFQENFTTGPVPRANELKANILSSILDNAPWMKALSSRFVPGGIGQSGVTVFGWLNEAPPKVSIEGSGISQQSTVLVYTNAEFKLPDSGFIAMPPGLIPGTMTITPRDGGTCGPTGTASVHMGRGEAEFEFQLPSGINELEIQSLKLALWRDMGNQWNMPQIGLYDWANNTWMVIEEPIQGTNVIREANPYVNSNGTVRVRLTSESDTFGCIYLDMGLEAERPAGQGG